MSVTLTQAQINELQAIANSLAAGQSGARVAYYAKLAEFGVAYGSLAGSVVLNDSLSGRMANAYLQAVAYQEKEIVLTPTQMEAIGNDLMLKDLAARLQTQQPDGNGGMVYPDLGYEEIKTYHAAAFSTLGETVPAGEGVSINAWTAYAPVETLGVLTWDAMLLESQAAQAGTGTGLILTMMVEAWSNADLLALYWVGVVMSHGFQTALSSGSPAVFADQVNDAFTVLGVDGAEAISVDGQISEASSVLVMALGGDDTITVGPNGDFYDGGAGDDLFVVTGPGGQVLHGNSGADTADFSGYGEAISASIAAAGEFGSVGLLSMAGIETLIGTGFDDSFHFQTLPVMSGVTEIEGGAGIDTVFMADYDPALDGLGHDQWDIDLAAQQFGGGAAVSGIENVVGGNADDQIRGDDGANGLIGGAGNDLIEGREGGDTLAGGDGADSLSGGSGSDQLWGGSGGDVLDGGEDADLLWGEDGDDSLLGAAGADALDGGSGNDTLRGGADADGLQGGDGADALHGDGGSDVLLGGAGADTLDGGLGDDELFGGLGADVIVFRPTSGLDVCADFELGVDRIDGSGVLVEADGGRSGVCVASGDAELWLPHVMLADMQASASAGLLWA